MSTRIKTTGDVEWTNDSVIRLMDEYKKRPELWDNTNDLYRAQTAKYLAWSELANLFDCDIADLRKKLNSLFASHRREKAKVRCGGVSSWFLYPYMKFLPTHLDNDNNTECVIEISNSANRHVIEEPEQSFDYDNQDSNQYSLHEEVMIKEEPVIETFSETGKKIKHCTHKPRLTRRMRKRVAKETSSNTSQLDSRLLETLRLLRRTDLARKKDECDSFGEYIADSLRKHDERTQSMIKQAINNILFEQEMKKYSVGQYAVVISNAAENPLILDSQENCNK